ncbi:MAG: hypothetical protein AAF389_05930 [Gemmatimonadota bacterium]
MTRLILLTLLAIVTWLYFPETRAIVLGVAEPIVTPIVRWSTEEDMAQIARNVVEHERLTGTMPAGSGWLAWLDYRYAAEDMYTDPWGSIYQMEATVDSVRVVSFGPDRVRMTDDDFGVSTARGS